MRSGNKLSKMRQRMGNLVYLLVYGVLLLVPADGFPFGAPSGTCWTMYPKHSNIPRQTSPSPFLVTLSPEKYLPGELITVTIAAPDGRNFTGFQIGAHRESGNPEEIVGQFTVFPLDKVKVFTCFGGYKNMATHWNARPTTSISLGWQAPAQNVGNVTFRTTVVANYATFWIDVLAPLGEFDESLPIAPPTYPDIPLQIGLVNMDFDSCGESKGCFLYPLYCSGTDCVAAATYQYRPATQDVRVELYTSTADIYQYISMALSEDILMGHDDETFTCVSNHGIMSVQQGYNPEYHNSRLLTRFISDTEVKAENGRLQCRFTIPMATEIYHINQTAPSFEYSATPISLTKKWHLQLAWGDAMPGSDVMAYHIPMPAVTESQVDIKSVSVQRGTAYHAMVRAHVAVMIIAWVFLSGIVTVISRHYKDWHPSTTWCGTKIWFQIHREAAFLIAILTALGLVFVFYHYGSEIREVAIPHAYVGLAVTAGVGVQILMGMLRPGGDHKLRPIYNWGHWALGHATHITAAVTMFLAYDIEHINRDMRKFGYATLSVWVAVQIVWYAIFEILRWRRNKKKTPETYAITSNDKDVQISETPSAVTSKDYSPDLWFAVYVTFLAAVCVACLLSFLMY